MAQSEIEQIDLRVWQPDLDDWEGDLEPYDPLFMVDATVSVVRLDEETFRVVESIPLTFLGRYGPGLRRGDVFEATLQEDGTYFFVRRLEHARLWRRPIKLQKLAKRLEDQHELTDRSEVYDMIGQVLQDGELGYLLDRLTEAGVAWEHGFGELHLEVPLQEGKSEPPTHIMELIMRLYRALGETPRGL